MIDLKGLVNLFGGPLGAIVYPTFFLSIVVIISHIISSIKGENVEDDNEDKDFFKKILNSIYFYIIVFWIDLLIIIMWKFL